MRHGRGLTCQGADPRADPRPVSGRPTPSPVTVERCPVDSCRGRGWFRRTVRVMLLREVRPEEFLRAGVVLGCQVAEQVGSCVPQARASATVRWEGRTHEQYQKQLASVVQDLVLVQRAYDAACSALIAYSRAMEPVPELAIQADLLEGQAGDLRSARSLSQLSAAEREDPSYRAIGPAEVQLRERARLLRAEAERISDVASCRVAAELRALTADAPHVSGWTSAGRGLAKFDRGFAEPAQGMAALAGDAVASLPLAGSDADRTAARRQLWTGAQAMAQPWLAIEDILAKFQQGEWQSASGSIMGTLVLRGHGGKRVALFGSHDALPLPVLTALRLPGRPVELAAVDAWVEANAQRLFWQDLQRFKTLPAPSVDELLRDGVNLIQQEALGGHTLFKHVGRDEDFLRRRQLAETKPGEYPNPASSFFDQSEAETVVNAVIGGRPTQDTLRRLAAGEGGSTISIHFLAEDIGTLINADGRAVAVRAGMLEFKRGSAGVFINRVLLKDEVLNR